MYHVPKARLKAPSAGVKRSKFLAMGPLAMASPNAVERSAIETAVPPAKITSAPVAWTGLGMVESNNSVSPPDPPMPCTSPIP